MQQKSKLGKAQSNIHTSQHVLVGRIIVDIEAWHTHRDLVEIIFLLGHASEKRKHGRGLGGVLEWSGVAVIGAPDFRQAL